MVSDRHQVCILRALKNASTKLNSGDKIVGAAEHALLLVHELRKLLSNAAVRGYARKQLILLTFKAYQKPTLDWRHTGFKGIGDPRLEFVTVRTPVPTADMLRVVHSSSVWG